jgi:hypothetical protein
MLRQRLILLLLAGLLILLRLPRRPFLLTMLLVRWVRLIRRRWLIARLLLISAHEALLAVSLRSKVA